MQLIQQAADWLSCYNARGEYLFADDINANLPFYPIYSIGNPTTNQIGTFQLNPTDVVLTPNGSAYGISPNATWPGGYIQITGTTNWNGTYLVKSVQPGVIWILQGEVTGVATETTGTFRTQYANMRLSARVGIEDTYNVEIEIPPSQDGLYRLSPHDYIKDYFAYQVTIPVTGGRFNQFSTTIRYAIIYAGEYDIVTKTWNASGKKYIYTKARKRSQQAVTSEVRVVNSALKYYDARLSGAGGTLSAFVVSGGNAIASVPFATYRPRNTYITQDEDSVITHLRAAGQGTYTGVITCYDNTDTPLQSIQITEASTGYVNPHHVLWNVGTAALTLPTGTTYYTFHVVVTTNAGTFRRTEVIRYNIEPKCKRFKLWWKNEFGAPDDFTFTGYTEVGQSAGFELAGSDTIVTLGNAGNYFKRETSSPETITLNSGLVNSEHAKWLLRLAGATEVFIEDLDGENLGVFPKSARLKPCVVDGQNIGVINNSKGVHNITIDVTIPFTVSQIGNFTQ
jgi:hypothetical protein